MYNTSSQYDIFQYTPNEKDLSVNNPYLKEILQYHNTELDEYQYWNLRYELIKKYAFAVPTFEILNIIKELSPIIEICAGNGYWAFMLNQLGCDIIAYDKYPPGDIVFPFSNFAHNYWFDEEWYPVEKGDATIASYFPNRTLFLCWPEPQNSMAFDALYSYKKAGGHTVIFIGDMIACADDRFYDMLSSFKLNLKKQIWGYKYFNEFIAIYSL